MQKHVLRNIKQIITASLNQYLKKTGILKLNDLYESQVALFMHHYISNLLPMSFDKTYNFNYEIQEDHQTRQSNQMY